jgi:hypothetical protein
MSRTPLSLAGFQVILIGRFWVIAEASEVSLYVSLLWLANQSRSNEFNSTYPELRKLANLSHATFAAALDRLETRGLFRREGDGQITFKLCDPHTGEPLHEATADAQDDPANYYEVDEKGREIRFDYASAQPEQLEKLILSCLPSNSRVSRSRDELVVMCPFHDDSTPSCSINLRKRVFLCRSTACDRRGTIKQFVMAVQNLREAEVNKALAHVAGKKVQFRDPNRNYKAIYSYGDKNGKLVKQVLRTHEKTFPQRRPAKGGGWIYDTKGLMPLLYKRDYPLWEFVGTFCLCEGEKDADSVNDLGLCPRAGGGGELLATTSGSASSWVDSLADDLVGKRVILMPHDDDDGAIYADKIIASLKLRQIEFRVVSFADVGANDVSDFLAEGHTKEELVGRIGADWVGTAAESPVEPEVLVEG